jgi:hypothetical protein
MAKLLERLAGRPTASIPAACHGWAETQAAYCLFDHHAVTAAPAVGLATTTARSWAPSATPPW